MLFKKINEILNKLNYYLLGSTFNTNPDSQKLFAELNRTHGNSLQTGI